METVLMVMGATLGLLVPYLFVFVISKGISLSPFDEIRKNQLKRKNIMIIGSWTAVVWILSLTGMFSFHSGDLFPRFLIPLFIPVLIGLALLSNHDFRTVLDNTPLSILAGVQTFRFAGFTFIIIAEIGILPMPFISGGYGDIITGTLALASAILLSKRIKTGSVVFLTFSAAGLIDLLNVAFLLLKYYPLWYGSLPNSAPAADFSLVMIPAIAAPVALLLHIYALRNFVLKK